MSQFLRQLETACRSLQLTGSRVLVGLSGGADSVALVRGLLELAAALRLEIEAAHLNHRLRGDGSDADARWVEGFCKEHNVPIAIERIDVAQQAQRQGRGIEETARECRYDFLDRLAQQRECSYVAVAHTADDQAETILHHILRGTSLDGLSGMPAQRGLPSGVMVVRPLLPIEREQVQAFLHEIRQSWCEDVSNADPRFTRNRIRHQLLPLLERDYNPHVRQALRRLGAQAGEVQELVSDLAQQALEEALVDASPTVCRLRRSALAGLRRHLVRECLVQLWKRQDWPRQHMGYAEWERLAELVHQEGTAMLPGAIEARTRADLLVLSPANR